MRSEHWSKLLLLYMTLRHVAPLRKQAQKIEASVVPLTLPPPPPYQRTSSAIIMIKIQATETSGTLLPNRRRMNRDINMCNQHQNFGKETTCHFNARLKVMIAYLCVIKYGCRIFVSNWETAKLFWSVVTVENEISLKNMLSKNHWKLNSAIIWDIMRLHVILHVIEYYKAQLWGYQNKLTKKIQFLNELKPCESSGIYLNNIDTISAQSFTYFYDGSLSISNYNSHQVPLIEHFLNGISPLSHWICKLTQIRKARNNFLQRNVPLMHLINAASKASFWSSFNDVNDWVGP